MPGPALGGGGATLDDTPSGLIEATPRRATLPCPIPAARLVASVDVVIVLAIFFALIIGINVDRMPNGLDEFLALRITVKNVLVVSSFAIGIAMLMRAFGLYDAFRVRRWSDEVRRVALATIPITGLAAIVPLTGRSNGPIDRLLLLLFFGATFVALVAARGIRKRLSHDPQRRSALIIGTGPRALRIYRELCSNVLTSYRVLGFIDTPSSAFNTDNAFITRRTLGSLEELEAVLARSGVDEVYVGLPLKSHYGQIQETIRVCEHLGVKALYPTDIVDTALAKPRMQAASDSAPHVQLQMAPEGVLMLVKRAIDVVGALACLIVLAPVMLAAALAIRLTSDGPVIYAQQRYGLNRHRFRMFKFRTMVQDAERLQASLESRNEASGPVFKIANDPRITPVGRFLRRSSIDELPQLFNVLRGDMSLVGPRPLPLRDVDRFTRTGDLRRFSMRPGVTCLWQISGRSGVGFDDWVALDLKYIDRWSLFLDALILVRTVPAVLRGTGAR